MSRVFAGKSFDIPFACIHERVYCRVTLGFAYFAVERHWRNLTALTIGAEQICCRWTVLGQSV